LCFGASESELSDDDDEDDEDEDDDEEDEEEEEEELFKVFLFLLLDLTFLTEGALELLEAIEWNQICVHRRNILGTYNSNRNQNPSRPSRNLCTRGLSMICPEIQRHKNSRSFLLLRVTFPQLDNFV